jgi:pyruvate kinase
MSPTPVRRTKIVATLGPSWDQPAQMTALLDAGVNVVRINASHGTPEIRARWIDQLRRILADRREAVAILLDLQGPRIRIGALHAPLRLTPGETVTFAPEDEAVPGEIPTTYHALASDVRVGARILLDDGLLALEVSEITGSRVRATVHYGGELKAHKGMNLPGIEVSAPALTEKDLEDVEQAVGAGVDYVALSFVRRRSRRTRRWETSAAFSMRRMRSWWREAISGWSCRSRKFPSCRRRSSGRPGCTGSR